MPIKYAEIRIIRNLKEESWFSYFKNLIGDEDIITNNDTIIISFDDGSISDTNNKLVNLLKTVPADKFFFRAMLMKVLL